MTKIEAASEDSATNTLDPMVHLVIKQLTAGKKEKYRLSTEGADIILPVLTIFDPPILTSIDPGGLVRVTG